MCVVRDVHKVGGKQRTVQSPSQLQGWLGSSCSPTSLLGPAGRRKTDVLHSSSGAHLGPRAQLHGGQSNDLLLHCHSALHMHRAASRPPDSAKRKSSARALPALPIGPSSSRIGWEHMSPCPPEGAPCLPARPHPYTVECGPTAGQRSSLTPGSVLPPGCPSTPILPTAWVHTLCSGLTPLGQLHCG